MNNMNNRRESYCTLIHYDFCDLKPGSPFNTTQILFADSIYYLAYIEEYDDFNSLESRISKLSREWIQGKIYQKMKYYNLMITLKNQWEDSILIGIYNYGEWYIPGMSNYSLESIDKKKNAKNNTISNTQLISFYMPTETTCFWRELISRQAAAKIVKEWLNTGGYTQYFLNNLGEIQTRKYPFDEETVKNIQNKWKNIDDDWTPISF